MSSDTENQMAELGALQGGVLLAQVEPGRPQGPADRQVRGTVTAEAQRVPWASQNSQSPGEVDLPKPSVTSGSESDPGEAIHAAGRHCHPIRARGPWDLVPISSWPCWGPGYPSYCPPKGSLGHVAQG